MTALTKEQLEQLLQEPVAGPGTPAGCRDRIVRLLQTENHFLTQRQSDMILMILNGEMFKLAERVSESIVSEPLGKGAVS